MKKLDKDRRYKMIVFFLLILLVVIAAVFRSCAGKMQEKDEKNQYSLPQKEKSQEPKTLTRDRIYNLKKQAGDNRFDGTDIDMELTFYGYKEHPGAFRWMSEEDWELFQNQLKAYLKNKDLDVTTVNLHADSQQVIDKYLRYLYLDVDYVTEDSETLLIKATCDTYTDKLRFGFHVEYGD